MKPRTLVLLLHGYTDGSSRLRLVRDEVLRLLSDTDVELPELSLSRMSFANLNDIVRALLELLDQRWSTRNYTHIIIIGHSAGALLARKLYIAACGSSEQAPLEPELLSDCQQPRPWAPHIDRIILLAGLNNGWSIDYHMSMRRALQYSVGVFFVRLWHLATKRWPTIFQIRRGAPFLTELRVQWLLMRRKADEAKAEHPKVAGTDVSPEFRVLGGAIVVQLLGTIDDLVSPKDNIDLTTGQDFFFLDVPNSGHSSVVEMDHSNDGRGRAAALLQALTFSNTQLRAVSEPLLELHPIAIRNDVQEVVFVIHGIRDEGFWTDKVAREIMAEGRDAGRIFARETSTYGYFGMLPFLSPWKRRQKVEWFMDKYAEALVRYPNATKFHYVAHSNGTYLLARALQDYRCCHFDRVVFAGSVVPSRYDWLIFLNNRPPRINQILNYAATADWVVAFFPNCFEYLGIPDIGGAGHKGFSVPANDPSASQRILNVKYVVGQHSAAVREGNWKALARFVVHGHLPKAKLSGVRTRKRHALFVAFFGLCPPLIWIGILVVLSLVPLGLIYGHFHYHWPEWAVTSLLIGYGSLVWHVGNQI